MLSGLTGLGLIGGFIIRFTSFIWTPAGFAFAWYLAQS